MIILGLNWKLLFFIKETKKKVNIPWYVIWILIFYEYFTVFVQLILTVQLNLTVFI